MWWCSVAIMSNAGRQVGRLCANILEGKRVKLRREANQLPSRYLILCRQSSITHQHHHCFFSPTEHISTNKLSASLASPTTQPNTPHHPSCLANPAVPPLRPSAPPSRLLSLALRPSSLLRLARPAPTPSLLRTSTPLLPPLPSRPRPQRAVVAVSSAKWPAPLRKLPQIKVLHHKIPKLTSLFPQWCRSWFFHRPRRWRLVRRRVQRSRCACRPASGPERERPDHDELPVPGPRRLRTGRHQLQELHGPEPGRPHHLRLVP
jgi:hypothetical protein